MKKFLKNLFAVLLICIVSLLVTGCGEKNNDIDDIIDKVQNNNKENDDKKNSEDSKNTSNEYDDLKLYSDDTKIVFNMENVYYIVYYHNGNDITGLEYIYDYPDAATARYTETVLKASYQDDSSVEKIEVKGKQLRVKFKESAYDGETLESVKQAYSYLKEVKEN